MVYKKTFPVMKRFSFIFSISRAKSHKIIICQSYFYMFLPIINIGFYYFATKKQLFRGIPQKSCLLICFKISN